MATPLHQSYSPQDLADKKQVIEYKGKIEEFSRLSEIVAADLGVLGKPEAEEAWRAAPVEIRLQFAWADARRTIPQVTGRVAADMPAICQRCLEVFRYPLEIDLSLALVDASEEQIDPDLQNSVETWEIEQDKMRLVDLVEESLIMAMPLAPTHDEEHSCGKLAKPEEQTDRAKVRPFADLKAAMEKTNK